MKEQCVLENIYIYNDKKGEVTRDTNNKHKVVVSTNSEGNRKKN